MFFADLYEDTSAKFRASVNRNTFSSFGLESFADAEIEHVEITPIGSLPTGHTSPQHLKAIAKFATRRLGSFTQTIVIPFVLEDNRWKIPWQWSLLVPNFSTNTHFETTVIPAHRGAILASDKKPLAGDIVGQMVWITPAQINPTEEETLLSELETVFGNKLPKVAIHQRIVGNTLPHRGLPIGVIPIDPNDAKVRALYRFQGISFTPAYTRLLHPNNYTNIGEIKNTLYSECCTYLYDTTNYDGISGVEHEKNSLLKGINGGTLILKNSAGEVVSTLIQTTKQDGKDVQP